MSVFKNTQIWQSIFDGLSTFYRENHSGYIPKTMEYKFYVDGEKYNLRVTEDVQVAKNRGWYIPTTSIRTFRIDDFFFFKVLYSFKLDDDSRAGFEEYSVDFSTFDTTKLLVFNERSDEEIEECIMLFLLQLGSHEHI